MTMTTYHQSAAICRLLIALENTDHISCMGESRQRIIKLRALLLRILQYTEILQNRESY